MVMNNRGTQVSLERQQEPPGERTGTPPEQSVGILLSKVSPERVNWLWKGRIPKGKLTVIEGDPGTGKSALTIDLAARVSAGRDTPDDSEGLFKSAGVVVMSAEDGLADTIRPRLDAAGGDPSRVLALPSMPDGQGGERLPSIPGDIMFLERAIEQIGAGLVIIDPLVAYLPAKIDSHKDQDVRRTLAALAPLAEKTGAAIVVVRHLNKADGGKPMYRGGGSIGIIASARSGLLVAKDPEDNDRRILASQKCNLAEAPPSLAFALVGAENGAVTVAWGGDSALTAAELLTTSPSKEDQSKRAEATRFLKELLADGPTLAVQVTAQAKEANIAPRTLDRAKADLGVRSEKLAEGWFLSLPIEGRQGRQGRQAGEPDGVSEPGRSPDRERHIL